MQIWTNRCAPHFNEIYCTLQNNSHAHQKNHIPNRRIIENGGTAFRPNRAPTKVIQNSWALTMCEKTHTSYSQQTVSAADTHCPKITKCTRALAYLIFKIIPFSIYVQAQSGFEFFMWSVLQPQFCCFSVVIHFEIYVVSSFIRSFGKPNAHIFNPDVSLTQFCHCEWFFSSDWCSIALTLLLDRGSNINKSKQR